MIQQKFIRPFLASFLMLVMIFSITPKRTVHEIFGCHDKKGTEHIPSKPGETTIGKDGFHCACEQQEFQTGFIAGIPLRITALWLGFHSPANTGIHVSFHAVERTLLSLRGPPAIA